MFIVMWETLRGMGEPGAFPCSLLCQVDNSFDPWTLTMSTDDPSRLSYIKAHFSKKRKNTVKERKHRKADRKGKLFGLLLSKIPSLQRWRLEWYLPRVGSKRWRPCLGSIPQFLWQWGRQGIPQVKGQPGRLGNGADSPIPWVTWLAECSPPVTHRVLSIRF